MNNSFVNEINESVKHWYIPLIIGLSFIGLGIWVFMAPASSYKTFSILFSISFLVSGILEILFAVANKRVFGSWGWALIMGILNLVLGILLLKDVEMAMEVLALYIGFLVLFRSLGAISTSLELSHFRMSGWGSLLVIGILGIILSTILIWRPQAAAFSVVIFMGLTLISFGASMAFISLKLKKVHTHVKELKEEQDGGEF
ncbi:HdeD family acid-resistance protein [Sediminitomix flava]|uniref:Uncharacterized membrane protein HdeD (DUF308 family) n=1 Tax=Sediminitomix flava TaxID=379075 RepID=A0A315ZEH5_SEDFL|nr:DUF308 domain-containing protein [Sediminitomix flava]PWJ43931.1 uncharacterized membrane protein HdeD (DUF308 family) [Sediminitomix flava]